MNQTDIILAIFFSILFAIVLIGGMAIIIYTAHRTRLRQQLNLAEAQAGYEQELRTVAREVQEQMLANLSGELHDNIGQRLTLVHLQLEAQRRNFKPEILQQANQNLVDAMKEVRQLSHALSADVLARQGLCAMITQEVKRLSQNGVVQVSFVDETVAEPDLTPDQRLMAFRLFQEGVNNALKHAGATTLTISLSEHPDFCLQLTDDGKGFDADLLLQESKGAGLRNMQQRAGLAGLQCTVISQPGQGCTIRLETAATDRTGSGLRLTAEKSGFYL